MNVSVVEPTSTLTASSADRESGHQEPHPQAEWIDPEGDDWFSSVYRELTEESATFPQKHAPELEHWFG